MAAADSASRTVRVSANSTGVLRSIAFGSALLKTGSDGCSAFSATESHDGAFRGGGGRGGGGGGGGGRGGRPARCYGSVQVAKSTSQWPLSVALGHPLLFFVSSINPVPN